MPLFIKTADSWYNVAVNGESFYSRTAALIGGEGVLRLQRAAVAVFGLGGVGGYVAEALARAGVGTITLVDGDAFKESNLNRQIFALKSNLGKNKAEAAAARLSDINGAAKITACPFYFNKETAGGFDFKAFDYVADAIDSVADKVLLIETAQRNGTRIISSMGAGNKIHTDFKVGDIFETKGCPLARVMRLKLKRAGITRLKTVYSGEAPQALKDTESGGGKKTPASISYVPAVCGLVLAGEIIRELINDKKET